MKQPICGICKNTCVEPQDTRCCNHIFYKVCINEYAFHTYAAKEMKFRCPLCNKKLKRSRIQTHELADKATKKLFVHDYLDSDDAEEFKRKTDLELSREEVSENNVSSHLNLISLI